MLRRRLKKFVCLFGIFAHYGIQGIVKCAKSLAGQKTSQFFEVKRFRALFFTVSRIFFKLHARFLTINDLFPAIILGLFKEKTSKIRDFNFFSTGNASKISMNSTASTLIKKPYETC